MENKLNVPKLEYKTGEPMWVHWDNADDLYWWYVTFSIDTTAI